MISLVSAQLSDSNLSEETHSFCLPEMIQQCGQWHYDLAIVHDLSSLAAGSHVLDEAERSLHDALCVLNAATADSRVLYGGGWPEMQMAKVGSQPGNSARFMPVPDHAPGAGVAPMRLPHAMSCDDLTAEITLMYRWWMRQLHGRRGSAAWRWPPLHARCGPSPRSSPTTQVLVRCSFWVCRTAHRSSIGWLLPLCTWLLRAGAHRPQKHSLVQLYGNIHSWAALHVRRCSRCLRPAKRNQDLRQPS